MKTDRTNNGAEISPGRPNTGQERRTSLIISLKTEKITSSNWARPQLNTQHGIWWREGPLSLHCPLISWYELVPPGHSPEVSLLRAAHGDLCDWTEGGGCWLTSRVRGLELLTSQWRDTSTQTCTRHPHNLKTKMLKPREPLHLLLSSWLWK